MRQTLLLIYVLPAHLLLLLSASCACLFPHCPACHCCFLMLERARGLHLVVILFPSFYIYWQQLVYALACSNTTY